ncbi:MAG TPA: hypothetical protein PKZ53_21840, partial [Acidobacteriota bacterium]|nr:hypothetical protein [Acidobacteriota bacterium]
MRRLSCTRHWLQLSMGLLFLVAGGLAHPEVVFGQEKGWVDRAPNQEARQEVAVTELQGRIYLIGGIANRIVSNTVERY